MIRSVSLRVVNHCPVHHGLLRSTGTSICRFHQGLIEHRSKSLSFHPSIYVLSFQTRGFITKWDTPEDKKKDKKKGSTEVDEFSFDEEPKKDEIKKKDAEEDEEIEEINLKDKPEPEVEPPQPLHGRLGTISSKDDRPKTSNEYWQLTESLKKARLKFYPPPDEGHIDYLGYLLEEREKRRYESIMAKDRARIDQHLHIIVDHSDTGSALMDFLNKFIEKIAMPDDWKINMTKHYDMSPAGYERWKARRQWKRDIAAQLFDPNTHALLGPDLAAAAFTVSRGGRVKFANKEPWFTRDEWDHLPECYDPEYRLQAIDAEGLGLMYEGFDNYILLEHLEEFNLANNPRLDDFTCDRIARQYRNSKKLRILNLRNNQLITHRGIEALVKIKSLELLDIRGTLADEYEFIELVELLFTDVVPKCKIIRTDRNQQKMIEAGEEDEDPEAIEDGQPKQMRQINSS